MDVAPIRTAILSKHCLSSSKQKVLHLLPVYKSTNVYIVHTNTIDALDIFVHSRLSEKVLTACMSIILREIPEVHTTKRFVVPMHIVSILAVFLFSLYPRNIF